MRVTIGMFGVLGLGVSVTVAMAQGPAAARRGATLLPPERLDPSEVTVARAAADDLPGFGSTPVTRPGPTGGPGWLNGTGSDPNVRPAAATSTGSTQPVRTLGGAPVNTGGKDDPSLFSKGFDRLKSTFNPPTPQRAAPVGTQPASGDAKNQASAVTPFRGTASNGAPVYAGPPAYRWYGWGSVTPGANPYAPTGTPPRASANWYSITGATPGAFPVPVMNPLRPPAGTEPPAYVAGPTPRTPVVAAPPPAPAPAPVPEMPRVTTPVIPDPRFAPTPTLVAPPVPTSIAPPAPEAPRPAAPVALPTLAIPPAPVALPTLPEKDPVGAREPEPTGPRVPTAVAALPTLPRIPDPVAVGTPLPAVPTVPMISAAPTVAGLPLPPAVPEAKPAPVAATPTTDPAPLPVSVTDETRWQPNTSKSPNEWNPAGGVPPAAPAPDAGQSRGTRAEPVARGQVGDNRPDPVAALIRKVCDGRGDHVDVRWVGSKKLIVCFECRTPPDAQKLVKDVSARPELAPYQIDFCVFVK